MSEPFLVKEELSILVFAFAQKSFDTIRVVVCFQSPVLFCVIKTDFYIELNLSASLFFFIALYDNGPPFICECWYNDIPPLRNHSESTPKLSSLLTGCHASQAWNKVCLCSLVLGFFSLPKRLFINGTCLPCTSFDKVNVEKFRYFVIN